MSEQRSTFLAQVNVPRYHGQPQGYYESFFQRANHPTRPLAFWIRYTLFSPRAHPEQARGELGIIVGDDGCGFDYSTVRRDVDRCLGLISMEERLALLGGTLSIESTLHKGTTVRVEVPIETPN